MTLLSSRQLAKPQVIFAAEPLPETVTRSIFLAGPTRRDHALPSWRTDALRILEARGFGGQVFAPETDSGVFDLDYEAQVEWERRALEMADVVLFWVPRSAELPAFTTNVEFGLYAGSGKAVFGAPPEADRVRYLFSLAERFGVPRAGTLEGTIDLALARLGGGATRTGGERDVPLFVWSSPSFQAWYRSVRAAGNRLDGARLEWTFRVGDDATLFAWVLHANVYVTAERRHKSNEVVIGRPDVSSVLLYARGATPEETRLVLVREFRSPSATSDGFVRELPSGSTFARDRDPRAIAAHEVREETGLDLAPERLATHGAAQLAGTFSTHRAHLYSAELTDAEIQSLEAWQGVARVQPGETETGERTYVEVRRLSEVMRGGLVDWSTRGMIATVLGGCSCARIDPCGASWSC